MSLHETAALFENLGITQDLYHTGSRIQSATQHHAMNILYVKYDTLPPQIITSYTPEQQGFIERMFHEWQAVILGRQLMSTENLTMDLSTVTGYNLPGIGKALVEGYLPPLNNIVYAIGSNKRRLTEGDVYIYSLVSTLDMLALTRPDDFIVAHEVIRSQLGIQGVGIAFNELCTILEENRMSNMNNLKLAQAYRNGVPIMSTPGRPDTVDSAVVCPAAPRRGAGEHRYLAYLLSEMYVGFRNLRLDGYGGDYEMPQQQTADYLWSKLEQNRNFLLTHYQ